MGKHHKHSKGWLGWLRRKRPVEGELSDERNEQLVKYRAVDVLEKHGYVAGQPPPERTGNYRNYRNYHGGYGGRYAGGYHGGYGGGYGGGDGGCGGGDGGGGGGC